MDIKRLTTLIGDFSSRKVLVVGDVMLDEYIFGSTTRLSPEAPIPVVKVEKTVFVLGGAANVANNLRSLGAEVILAGLVGKDQEGKRLLRLLKQVGVNVAGVVADGQRETTTKRRIISRGQHVVRIDREDIHAVTRKNERRLLGYISKKIEAVDAVIISDYAKGVITGSLARRIIKLALKGNKPIIVDPKGNDFKKYRGCTVITPNISEMEQALKLTINSLDALPFLMKKIKNLVKSIGVVAKLGEHGMALIGNGDTYIRVAATQSSAIDVSGTGDTAVSVLAMSFASGIRLPEAIILANAACGVVVSKVGTATVSLAELEQALGRNYPKKILDAPELGMVISNLKTQGKKIVMTGGVFDILHPGHTRYLRKAKALGDILVVALNSDYSARKNKGPKRPINNQSDRAEVISQLSCVDFVTIFDDLTPVEIISKFRPNIWVKGGDYNENNMPEAKVVKSYGGVIRILPNEAGFSVSALVEKIAEEHPAKIPQEGSFAK